MRKKKEVVFFTPPHKSQYAMIRKHANVFWCLAAKHLFNIMTQKKITKERTYFHSFPPFHTFHFLKLSKQVLIRGFIPHTC